MSEMLNPKEAAKLLSVSVRTLRRWASLGKGPAFVRYNARTIRYDWIELIRFKDEHQVIPGIKPAGQSETP